MRYLKTYGARGLIEFNMTLRSGHADVKIAFTGGRMGDNGVLAATYVTDNPAIQRLIEGSRSFKGGRVFLYGDPIKLNDDSPLTKATDPTATTNNQGHEIECRRADQESPCDDGGRPDDYV